MYDETKHSASLQDISPKREMMKFEMIEFWKGKECKAPKSKQKAKQ
jgi:hypothetical protein